MTKEQMLTEVVRAMGFTVSEIMFYKDSPPDIIIQQKDEKLGIERTDVKPLTNLLCNASALKAAYGEAGCIDINQCKLWCNQEKDGKPPKEKMCFNTHCTYGENKTSLFRLGYSYISHKALDLLQTGGDAIKYLYDNLPKQGGGK
jgi:hypothetical protein